MKLVLLILVSALVMGSGGDRSLTEPESLPKIRYSNLKLEPHCTGNSIISMQARHPNYPNLHLQLKLYVSRSLLSCKKESALKRLDMYPNLLWGKYTRSGRERLYIRWQHDHSTLDITALYQSMPDLMKNLIKMLERPQNHTYIIDCISRHLGIFSSIDVVFNQSITASFRRMRCLRAGFTLDDLVSDFARRYNLGINYQVQHKPSFHTKKLWDQLETYITSVKSRDVIYKFINLQSSLNLSSFVLWKLKQLHENSRDIVNLTYSYEDSIKKIPFITPNPEFAINPLVEMQNVMIDLINSGVEVDKLGSCLYLIKYVGSKLFGPIYTYKDAKCAVQCLICESQNEDWFQGAITNVIHSHQTVTVKYTKQPLRSERRKKPITRTGTINLETGEIRTA